jgi:5'-3' exonuclease
MAFADDFVMAVKGEGNYRDDIYSDYKGHRTVDPNSVRASVVPAIRQLAVMEDMAVFANGREADDLVRIWAGEAERGGVDYVIARADKDLACIPGQHLRVFPDMRKATMELITPEHATRFYYEQLLQGDAVDKIPGIPRIGPKKATKLLEDYNTEEDFQNIVLAEYINAFGDNWESHLLSNGKMIYIQKHLNDYFSFDNWPLAKEMRGV